MVSFYSGFEHKNEQKISVSLRDDIDRMGKFLIKSKSSVGIFNSKYLKLLESKNWKKKKKKSESSCFLSSHHRSWLELNSNKNNFSKILSQGFVLCSFLFF